MDVQPDVDQLVQKTRQYEFVDGLRDLQMGVYFAVSGVTLWLVLDPIWMSVLSSLVKSFGRWAALIGIVPAILPLLVLLGFLRGNGPTAGGAGCGGKAGWSNRRGRVVPRRVKYLFSSDHGGWNGSGSWFTGFRES